MKVRGDYDPIGSGILVGFRTFLLVLVLIAAIWIEQETDTVQAALSLALAAAAAGLALPVAFGIITLLLKLLVDNV